MSIRIMTLVWDKFPASGSELLAMLALADWAGDDGGSLYPSMAAVGAKIRLSEKQARRIVQGFVKDGYLSVVGNESGGAPGSTKQFRFNVAKLAGLPDLPTKTSVCAAKTPPASVTPPVDVTPPMGVREGSHRCPETAPTHGSLTVIEPLVEPSVGGERAQAPATPTFPKLVDDFVEPVEPTQAGKQAEGETLPAAKPAKAAAARTTSLPLDFEPGEACVELAARLGVTLAGVDGELARFEDYHAANGTKFSDWQAGLRTWIRNAAKFAKRDEAVAAAKAAPVAETAYQRSMRERVQQFAPSLARQAPSAQPAKQSAVEFFNAIEVPVRTVGALK